MKRCERCGELIPDEVKFCTNCGAAVPGTVYAPEEKNGNYANAAQTATNNQEQWGSYQPTGRPFPPAPEQTAVQPKDLLMESACSKTFLTTAIMLTVSVFLCVSAVFILIKNLVNIIGDTAMFGTFNSVLELYGISFTGLLNMVKTRSAVVIIVMNLPVIIFIISAWLVFAGGKRKSEPVINGGIILALVDTILLSLPLLLLPLISIILSFNSKYSSGDLLGAGIITLAFFGFLFVPTIIACIRSLLVIKGKQMKTYKMPVVAASLITLGVIITFYGFGIMMLSVLYGLAVVLISVTLYLSAAVVIVYNSNIKKMAR